MANLHSRFSQIVNLIMLPTTVILIAGFNSQAIAQLFSESGNLKIEWLRFYEQSCATGKPHGTYSFKNDISGLLYADDRCKTFDERDSWGAKFVDTSGIERCTGTARFTFGGYSSRLNLDKAVIYWEVRDVVFGYTCSTIGESYETTVYHEIP